jgi:DNA-binding response OmpR family regulator
MLVDDDPDILILLGLRLAGPGFEVVGQATNGRDAIEVAAATQPEVIVLDIDMPILDGLSAIAAIRVVAPGAVILVCSSGTIYDDNIVRIRELADGFIDKLEAVATLQVRLAALFGPATSPA